MLPLVAQTFSAVEWLHASPGGVGHGSDQPTTRMAGYGDSQGMLKAASTVPVSSFFSYLERVLRLIPGICWRTDLPEDLF